MKYFKKGVEKEQWENSECLLSSAEEEPQNNRNAWKAS